MHAPGGRNLILVLCIVFLLAFSFNSLSQNSRFTISDKEADDFFSDISTFSLIVPLKFDSEKENNALKEAVKKYWKHTPYKFVTKKEFEGIQQKEPEKNKLYLVKETYERLKYRRKDWAYSKFYLSRENGGVEVLNSPYIEFKVPIKSEDRWTKQVDGSFIYGLMMKQMNFDVGLMFNMSNYKPIQRKSLIKDKFTSQRLKPYSNRVLLVSKSDFQNYAMNLRDSKKTVHQEEKFLKYISKKTALPLDKIKYETEDNISKAVSSSDKSKLVYTGFSIYNPENGELLRRIDPNSGKRKRKAFVTVLLTGVLVGTGLFLLTS